MKKKNHHSILGISKNAPKSEIAKKYRELAPKYHPDKNVNSKDYEKKKELFNKISEAYEVLSNDNKRKINDCKYNYFNNDNTNDIFKHFDSLFKNHMKEFEQFDKNIIGNFTSKQK